MSVSDAVYFQRKTSSACARLRVAALSVHDVGRAIDAAGEQVLSRRLAKLSVELSAIQEVLKSTYSQEAARQMEEAKKEITGAIDSL